MTIDTLTELETTELVERMTGRLRAWSPDNPFRLLLAEHLGRFITSVAPEQASGRADPVFATAMAAVEEVVGRMTAGKADPRQTFAEGSRNDNRTDARNKHRDSTTTP